MPVVTTPLTNASCATNRITIIGRAKTTQPAIIKCQGITPYPAVWFFKIVNPTDKVYLLSTPIK